MAKKGAGSTAYLIPERATRGNAEHRTRGRAKETLKKTNQPCALKVPSILACSAAPLSPPHRLVRSALARLRNLCRSVAQPHTPSPLQRAANLRKWNLITAGIHLLCGVVIFGITSQDNTVAIVTTYANPDGRETPNWLPLIVREGKAVVGYYSGVFLLLCFLDHFLVATLFRSQYEWYLKRAQNPFRYAVGGAAVGSGKFGWKSRAARPAEVLLEKQSHLASGLWHACLTTSAPPRTTAGSSTPSAPPSCALKLHSSPA